MVRADRTPVYNSRALLRARKRLFVKKDEVRRNSDVL